MHVVSGTVRPTPAPPARIPSLARAVAGVAGVADHSVHVPVSRATYSSASPSLRVSDSKTAGPAFSPPCRRLLSSNAREAREVGTPVAIAGLDLSVEHCSDPAGVGWQWGNSSTTEGTRSLKSWPRRDTRQWQVPSRLDTSASGSRRTVGGTSHNCLPRLPHARA